MSVTIWALNENFQLTNGNKTIRKPPGPALHSPAVARQPRQSEQQDLQSGTGQQRLRLSGDRPRGARLRRTPVPGSMFLAAAEALANLASDERIAAGVVYSPCPRERRVVPRGRGGLRGCVAKMPGQDRSRRRSRANDWRQDAGSCLLKGCSIAKFKVQLFLNSPSENGFIKA